MQDEFGLERFVDTQERIYDTQESVEWWAKTIRRMQQLAGRDWLTDDEASDLVAYFALEPSRRPPVPTTTAPSTRPLPASTPSE